jgi:hypothetical protein
MRKIIPVFLILLASCGDTQPKEEGEKTKVNEETITDSLETEVVPVDDETENEWQEVVSAKIGDYQEIALMVLKESGENEDGTVNVEGYYFYVKHQKKLQLSGVKDPISGKYVLTEFYKEKPTGYMEFIIGDKNDESFWSPANDTEDEQEMIVTQLVSGDPYELTIELNSGDFENPHTIEFYQGEEEGWTEEDVIDELHITNVNGEFLLFDISVTGRNAHTGDASGLAIIDGYEAKWTEPFEDLECTLYFDLSRDGEITVTEENCDYYHGMNAYFDGIFVKK